eukprot:scaffold125143_cov39-Phaeocystis_antarctica.AAC.2
MTTCATGCGRRYGIVSRCGVLCVIARALNTCRPPPSETDLTALRSWCKRSPAVVCPASASRSTLRPGSCAMPISTLEETRVWARTEDARRLARPRPACVGLPLLQGFLAPSLPYR